jgi:hypothetical protein
LLYLSQRGQTRTRARFIPHDPDVRRGASVSIWVRLETVMQGREWLALSRA